MIKGKYYKLLIPLLVLLIGIPTIHYFKLKKQYRESILVQVQPIRTSTGWGYNILTDGKIYIHQDYIPAIPGRQSFQSREDALKAGHAVITKINSQQLPTISVEELKKMGIVKDSLPSR